MPATLSTPCDIIGQKAAFFEFFRLASKLAMSKKSSKIKGFRDRKNISTADEKANYDASCKRLLAEKIILVYCIIYFQHNDDE